MAALDHIDVPLIHRRVLIESYEGVQGPEVNQIDRIPKVSPENF
jgi:hypothetical protein